MIGKTGILYYEKGSDLLSVLEGLIAYHRRQERELLEIYANPEQLLNVQVINGIRVLTDKQIMPCHYWLITGDEDE